MDIDRSTLFDLIVVIKDEPRPLEAAALRAGNTAA